jgi:hypothetical protein
MLEKHEPRRMLIKKTVRQDSGWTLPTSPHPGLKIEVFTSDGLVLMSIEDRQAKFEAAKRRMLKRQGETLKALART